MIRINDDYVIETDGLQYIVRKDLHRLEKYKTWKGTEAERDAYDTIGYFGTLGGAIKRVSEKIMMDKVSEEDINLTEAVAEYQKLTKVLIDTIDKAELTELIASLDDDLK